MNFVWIRLTEGLKSGIKLINQIDQSKFQQLLTHIMQNLTEKTDLGLFTLDELNALEKVLKLSSDDVSLVIKTIRHIIRRMVKFIMRPVCLLSDLTETLEMDREKAEIFVDKYKCMIKSLADDFSISNFGSIEEIKNTQWQVNLEMTSNKNQLERCTTVLMDLQTIKENKSPNNNLVEFDCDEIKNFHQQLEIIQNEVDNCIN